MEKLKNVIEQYGRWSILSIYVDRITAHIDTDFSLCADNSKALLESISKQICKEKDVALKGDESINKLVKFAFQAIGFEKESYIDTIGGSLSAIAHQIGNLRTSIGSASHGKTLEELEMRNHNLDSLTKEFLVSTVEMISCFLIRHFENENPRIPNGKNENAVTYYEGQEFNDFWDDLFGEFVMGNYSFTASEILFSVDNDLYTEEYNAFMANETTEE